MSAILQRLQLTTGRVFPQSCQVATKKWIFAQGLTQLRHEFFLPLVKNHPLLQIEYSTQCAQIVDKLEKGTSLDPIQPQLESALMLAELLERIYDRYLIVPREVMALRTQQQVLRAWLANCGYQFDPINPILPVHSKTRAIRDSILSANWIRLSTLRTRRLLISLTPVVDELYSYRKLVNSVDNYVAPVIAYFGWLFFIPRLLTNLFLLAKHVTPGCWMSADERSIDWAVRLRAQLDRRWFELGNDSVWFTAGIINCFVLTGALAPVSLYVGAALQAYDVILASIRAYIEISRLNELKKQYQDELDKLQRTNPNSSEYAELQEYLKYFNQRIAFEKKGLSLQVTNACIILIAASAAIPLLTFFPIIPLIGALLAVLTTPLCYAAVQWVAKQRPKDKIPMPEKYPGLLANSIFSGANKARNDSLSNSPDDSVGCFNM